MMPINLLTKLQPFAIALAIGLLIGVERERSHPPGKQPLGSRTFVLFGLMGAISAGITDTMIAVALTLFVGAVVIAGYLRSSRNTETEHDIGFTTEVAAVLTYSLGFLSYSEPFIALLIGVTTLVVLMARTRLHIFSRRLIKRSELQAAAVLLILGIGIIPFLPNQTLDPWHFFNPQQFGILVLIILLLQFSAYVGIRLLGATRGILLLGFLSGFVSSTAATATLSNKAYNNEIHPFTGSAAVILSTTAMYLELLIIIFLAAPNLLLFVSSPLLVSGILASITSLLFTKKARQIKQFPPPRNPLAIVSAIRLASFLAGMLIAVSIAQRILGSQWALLITFLGGLVEIHGVTLAIATLFNAGKINGIQAMSNLNIALIASFVSKYFIIWSLGRTRYTVYTSSFLGLMLSLLIMIWLAILFSV